MSKILFSHEHGDDHLTYTTLDGLEIELHVDTTPKYAQIDGETILYGQTDLAKKTHYLTEDGHISADKLMELAYNVYDDVIAETARENAGESYGDMVRSEWVGKEY